jgi:surface antigen
VCLLVASASLLPLAGLAAAITAAELPGTHARAATPRQPSPPAAVDDDSDEIAALEAVRIALTEVGDGGAYVWRRRRGSLSGVVMPTVSFKDGERVCRHIRLLLTRGERVGTAEGIACRLADGRWQFEG